MRNSISTSAQDNWRKLIEAKSLPSDHNDNGHGIPYRILLAKDGTELGRVPINGRFTGTKKAKRLQA